MKKEVCSVCKSKLRRVSFWKSKPVCSECYAKLMRERKTEVFKKGRCDLCGKNITKHAKLCSECRKKQRYY